MANDVQGLVIPGAGHFVAEEAPDAVLAGLTSSSRRIERGPERSAPWPRAAPPHDWWDWYAAYMAARQAGSTPRTASVTADRYRADVKHVAPAA